MADDERLQHWSHSADLRVGGWRPDGHSGSCVQCVVVAVSSMGFSPAEKVSYVADFVKALADAAGPGGPQGLLDRTRTGG